MATIKDCFPSRFPGGAIMEADYSGLEVAGLAIVTGDRQLTQDLKDGVDFHCLGATFLDPTLTYEAAVAGVKAKDKRIVDLRKAAKPVRFSMQYGGGAASISAKTGLSLETVKAFMAADAERYPQVAEWKRKVADEVERTAKLTALRTTTSGAITQAGYYTSVTGRRYVFFKDDAPEWMQARGASRAFKPTQLANYGIQGFSGGDLFVLSLNKLARRLRETPAMTGRVLLVNTVHDSVIIDVDARRVNPEAVAKSAKRVLDGATAYLAEVWGIETGVPVVATVSWGPTWGDQCHNL